MIRLLPRSTLFPFSTLGSGDIVVSCPGQPRVPKPGNKLLENFGSQLGLKPFIDLLYDRFLGIGSVEKLENEALQFGETKEAVRRWILDDIAHPLRSLLSADDEIFADIDPGFHLPLHGAYDNRRASRLRPDSPPVISFPFTGRSME